MKVKDLPVYSEYPEEDVEYELEMRPLNLVEKHLVQYVKPVRCTVQKWLACVQVKCSYLEYTGDSVSRASSATNSIYELVRDEPIILARGGFITVCGLGGLIMGYKGGIFRKLFYASLFTAAATSACYPAAAYAYGNKAWNIGTKKALEWKEEYFPK
ncbi:hypothetical protein X801_09694, partial [Opisthorchis viverrini]